MRRDALARGLRALLVGALLSLPGVAAAGGVLKVSLDSSDRYGESFSFVADADDGTYVTVNLSVTNIGPGSRTGICRATVLRPGKAAWAPQTRLGAKEWSYDPDSDTLKLGTCSARATDTGLTVDAALDNGRVTLEYAKKPEPWSPEGSVVENGKDRYRHEVLLGGSPVKVTLQAPKTAAVVLTGGGYADHSRSTVAPAKLAKRWVRFRALKGPQHAVVLGREGQEGDYAPVYVWEDKGAAKLLESFTLTQTGAKEKSTWRAELTDRDGKPAMTLRGTSLLQRSAPVESLGVLSGLVRPVVGSPVTYLLRGVMERPGKAPVDGLMEVTLEGE
ncbi:MULTISPECIES: hypothetical protein [unclassified Corallococcus]|uniref:hypothetical protein n=1 Tax=unclassified Corallococcus TaxID=2685029 RepID=UPI001A9086EA|nr:MULTISPECIES: hypothetical protein [unclassified Corallococcus]MBN9680982.1 hypothetical protein [Corallococcus sp. NCSPR001]WAS87422.1 hypothetical protein O0N60_10680 [Corallococcus sp. NCRR]